MSPRPFPSGTSGTAVRATRVPSLYSVPKKGSIVAPTTCPAIKLTASKAIPPIHYAGRFAAKEAIKKASLSSGIVSNIDFAAIEILSSESGAPEVQLNHPLLDKISCEVSISHTNDTAIAFALVRVL